MNTRRPRQRSTSFPPLVVRQGYRLLSSTNLTRRSHDERHQKCDRNQHPTRHRRNPTSSHPRILHSPPPQPNRLWRQRHHRPLTLIRRWRRRQTRHRGRHERISMVHPHRVETLHALTRVRPEWEAAPSPAETVVVPVTVPRAGIVPARGRLGGDKPPPDEPAPRCDEAEPE